jgi:hypothetical protein
VVGLAEVDEFGHEAAGHHDVDGLEVEVDHSAPVQVPQPLDHVQQQLQLAGERH